MPRYIVWNPEKVANNCSLPQPETYLQLLQCEAEMNGVCSTEVQSSDIESVVLAFENEADVTLRYHIAGVIVVYRDEYVGVFAAMIDGAVEIHPIPQNLSEDKRELYIAAFEAGLRTAGMKECGDVLRYKMETFH